MKNRIWTKRTILAGAAVLIAAPTAWAISGGAFVNGGYIGPLPASWFADEPCNTEPITFVQDDFIDEWQVDVSAVANDGDPNTYARCILKANNQVNVCIVGLADGTVIGCRDDSGPHLLPREGDMLHLDFLRDDIDFCNVSIGTHYQFGVADPKCREPEMGTGGGTSTGLGCNATNSTPVVKASGTLFTEGQCYSYNKTNGTLKAGTWSGVAFNIEIEDSAMNSVSAAIGSGGYTDIGGVANGTIYFVVDVPTSYSVNAQLDNW